jgi:hypothetical protein
MTTAMINALAGVGALSLLSSVALALACVLAGRKPEPPTPEPCQVEQIDREIGRLRDQRCMYAILERDASDVQARCYAQARKHETDHRLSDAEIRRRLAERAGH